MSIHIAVIPLYTRKLLFVPNKVMMKNNKEKMTKTAEKANILPKFILIPPNTSSESR